MRRGDVAVPLAEDGGSAADGQLGAVHYGGARARGSAALFLQVAAIATVSALLTVLGAGNVQVSVQFAQFAVTRPPTLSPPAAPPARSPEPSAIQANSSSLSPSPAPWTKWSEGMANSSGRRGRARRKEKGMGKDSRVYVSNAFDLQGEEERRKKRARRDKIREDERRRGHTREYVYNANSTDPNYLSQVWPAIILLGVQKGGTTSISSLINSHSAVCFNKAGKDGKETHFHHKNDRADKYAMEFGTDPSCSRPIQAGDREQAMTKHPILAGRVHLGGRHFEGTPNLFHDPSQVQRFVTSIPKALRPHLKFVIILREPISRDLSAYNHMRRSHASWWTCPSNEGILKTSNDYNAYLRTFVECWKDTSLPDGVPPPSQHRLVLVGPEGECGDCSKGVVNTGRYSLSIFLSRLCECVGVFQKHTYI